MKKILGIFLALVAIWLFRPDFNFKKEEHQPVLSRADVPTVEKTIDVKNVSVLDDEEVMWAKTAISMSENYTKNVVLVFKEEGGWNERLFLTIYDREDGRRIWMVEREDKQIVDSGKGYGEVLTLFATVLTGEVEE